jgi:uncharacterized protein (DUF1697 family)
MPTYVAFLRAINLGKNRKFPMAELRACLEAAGFGDVETHIQTGNVRLRTGSRSTAVVERRLEELFAADRGFDVPTFVLTPAELRRVYDDAQLLEVDAAARRYVTLLKAEPPAETAAVVDGWSSPGEGARVVGRAVHWWLEHPTVQARFSNAHVERQLGPATTRDLKVITTLAQRWGA